MENEKTLIDWLALVAEETPEVVQSRAVFRRMLHELAEEQPYEQGDETPRSWRLPGFDGLLPSIVKASLNEIGGYGGATDDFEAMEEWIEENKTTARDMKAPWLALVRSQSDRWAYVMLWDGEGKHVSRFSRGGKDDPLSSHWLLEAFLDFDNNEELVQRMAPFLGALRAQVNADRLDASLPETRPARPLRF